jgi:hypothetical protein
MIGALLCLAAAALTMIGTFQDLVVVDTSTGFGRQTFTITAWEVRAETNGVVAQSIDDSAPVNGVPLLFAAALLLAAAVGAMLARVRRSATPGGLVTALAATFLVAVVAMVGVQARWWTKVFEPGPVGGQEGVSVTVTSVVGPGLWMMITGAVVAIAAAVTVGRRRRPEAERVEPDTPRLGTPLVVRLPDEPQEPPDPR